MRTSEKIQLEDSVTDLKERYKQVNESHIYFKKMMDSVIEELKVIEADYMIKNENQKMRMDSNRRHITTQYVLLFVLMTAMVFLYLK